MAALGVSFARTLASDDVPPRVLETLRMISAESLQHLRDTGATDAADMFEVFAKALHDPQWFLPPKGGRR